MLGRLKSGVFIASMAEADWFMVLIRDSAAHIQTYVAEPPGDPVALVQRLMLEPSAAQAVSGQEPDLGEQVRLTCVGLPPASVAVMLTG